MEWTHFNVSSHGTFEHFYVALPTNSYLAYSGIQSLAPRHVDKMLHRMECRERERFYSSNAQQYGRQCTNTNEHGPHVLRPSQEKFHTTEIWISAHILHIHYVRMVMNEHEIVRVCDDGSQQHTNTLSSPAERLLYMLRSVPVLWNEYYVFSSVLYFLRLHNTEDAWNEHAACRFGSSVE